jgi:pimeloyl-ACP methyl ester carboxylesterase
MSGTEKVTSADGTSIAFERMGAGPTIVLVDAAGCFRAVGPTAPLVPALSGDFTVVSYDRRGRGESTDTLPYSVDREVEDLQAVIAAVGDSALVYGFSSGGVLALYAATRGLPISKLVLMEPPLADRPPSDGPDLGAQIAALVDAGRRGDAVEHFQTSIGVPADMVAGMRQSPLWPAMEALAHTLVYDTTITSTLPRADLTAATTPTLVLDSEGSDQRLRTWARDTATALPHGTHRSLPGDWHGIAPADLARAITAFCSER